MKSGIKTAVSLLIAIFIFGALAVASSLGLFASVERQFYEPARLKVINEKLDSVADCSNEYIQNLLNIFGAEKDGFLSHESVLSFAGQNPSAEALRLFESLKENCAGLEGFRIVDSAGKRVFYSSFRSDYVIKTEKGVQRRIYSNYANLQTKHGKNELEYPLVSAFENGSDENLAAENENAGSAQDLPRIIFDGDEQRLIFSYKIQTLDEKPVFCSAIFYVNPVDFANLLVENHVVSVNEPISLVSSADGKTGGFVFGLPNVGKNIFASEILKKWNQGVFGPDEIVASAASKIEGISVHVSENSAQEFEPETGSEKKDSEKMSVQPSAGSEKNISWSLISSRNAKFLHVGGIFSSETLKMPFYVRILLFVCAFVTVCLIVVIFFNIRKDDSVVIKSKIRAIQIGLLNEYFEKDVDRKKVAAMIAAQKDALTAKIKKSLGRRGKKYGSDLDVILNKSWEDIITILSGAEKTSCMAELSSSSIKEIRKIFEEVLATNTLKVENLESARKEKNPPCDAEPLEEAPEAESVEEVENLEEIEPLEEAEPLEPESDGALEELEEPDEPEELENPEEIDPAEELLPEAEELDEAEELEPLEEAEPLEPESDGALEELEEPDEPEELENLEEIDPAEELLPEPEELDEAEELEPLEELEEPDGLEEVEPSETIEPSETAEPSVDIAFFENPEELSEDETEKNETLSGSIEISGCEQKFCTKDNSVSFVPSENCDRRKFEGSEPLVISDSATPLKNDSDDDVEKDFVIYRPFDFAKENSENSDSESTDFTESEENAREAQDAAPLEELSSEKDGFMFTTFAENDAGVTELPLDAIVLGEDGVFHISSEIAKVEMPIDEDFKKLVDSVIR